MTTNAKKKENSFTAEIVEKTGIIKNFTFSVMHQERKS